MEMWKNIPMAYLMTGQEHSLIASTPIYSKEEDGTWYMPEAVITGMASIEEVQRARREAGFYRGSAMVSVFVNSQDVAPIAIKFQDIDEQTGASKADPEVIGYLREIGDKTMLVFHEGLTVKLFDAHESRGSNLRLRKDQA